MVHESIRLYRLYCELSAEMVADVTGIPLSRYKKIELGEVEPSASDAEKLAKLFNVEVSELLNGITDLSRYSVRQDIDNNVFMTDEMREMAKIKITDLSPDEKRLILLIRGSDNSINCLDEATRLVLEKIQAESF